MEVDKKMAQTTTAVTVVVCEDSQPKPISAGRKLLYHLWDNNQHLKSPEERKLVRKLDFGILICAAFG
jgi:ACS family pantothenate transporter-like MFS transporter